MKQKSVLIGLLFGIGFVIAIFFLNKGYVSDAKFGDALVPSILGGGILSCMAILFINTYMYVNIRNKLILVVSISTGFLIGILELFAKIPDMNDGIEVINFLFITISLAILFVLFLLSIIAIIIQKAKKMPNN